MNGSSYDATADLAGSRPWWWIEWYALAMPLAFVVVVWTPLQVHPATIYRPLLAVLVCAGALTFVLSGLARSRELGGLAAVATMLAAITQSVPGVSPLLLGAAGLFVGLGLARRGRPWPTARLISRGMRLFGAIIALTALITVVQGGALSRSIEEIAADIGATGRERGESPGGAPDIYLILLDGYPGTESRALLPDYPPSGLRDALLDRGFQMDETSHSNYLQTISTLTSLFEMRHLADMPGLDRPWGPDEADARRLRLRLNDSAGLARLRELGYEVTATASGFAEVELRRVDRLIESPQLNEFEIGLLKASGLGHVVENVAPDLLSGMQRERIRASFDTVAAIARESADNPRFVFAHVVAPHPPWVFGPNGEPRRDGIFTFVVDYAPDRQIEREEAIRLHLDQAAYTDTLLLETVDELIAESEPPPIIVIFSDHGPGTGFDTEHPLDSDLIERTSNILAFYTPGLGEPFYAPRTPVNILPAIFSAYFDQDIPFAEDSVWAWGESRLEVIRQPQIER